jgi:hypothetical protein
VSSALRSHRTRIRGASLTQEKELDMRKLDISPILVAVTAIAAAACSATDGGEDIDSTEQYQLGDKLDGILAADFIAAKATFKAVEARRGLNLSSRRRLRRLPHNGAIGGTGDQIERRWPSGATCSIPWRTAAAPA